jgi:hypothetical protein
MSMTAVTVTASRRGLTPPQLEHATRRLAALGAGVVLRHGCAVGGDAQLHRVARAAGVPVHGYPSDRPDQRMPIDSAEFEVLHDPAAPLLRNRWMVLGHDGRPGCVHLLVFPDTTRPVVRSGTWSTWRLANGRGVPWTAFLPDGRVRLHT